MSRYSRFSSEGEREREREEHTVTTVIGNLSKVRVVLGGWY